MATEFPPQHTVRESRRAKHVHLRYSLRGGLEVVVPPGFDRSEISQLLQEKSPWIAHAVQETARLRRLLDPASPDEFPARIELRALGESWRVEAVPTESPRILVREAEDSRLVVSGPVLSSARWRPALKRWLAGKARSCLSEWVKAEAAEHRLFCGTVSIRWQRSRWGSCSRRSGRSPRSPNLSLNASLLFLPRPLVRYVVLHELCHTTWLNHSAAFWRQLETLEPVAREQRQELRTAWRFVPSWVDGASASSLANPGPGEDQGPGIIDAAVGPP